MPVILKSLNLSDFGTGLATGFPYLIGTVGMISWSWSSDKRNERRWHFVIAAIIAAVGLAASGPLVGSWWALAAMSVATVGLYGTKPAFWRCRASSCPVLQRQVVSR